MTSADFTIAADVVERLRYEAEIGEISQGLFDVAHEAADLIERFADRVNHLTNVNGGLRETIAETRAGLAELRAMVAPEQPA